MLRLARVCRRKTQASQCYVAAVSSQHLGSCALAFKGKVCTDFV